MHCKFQPLVFAKGKSKDQGVPQSQKGERKLQGVPQSQAAAIPSHQEEEPSKHST